MNALRFSPRALAFCASVAMLAGCGGSQTGVSESIPMGAITAGKSVADVPSGDLLYVYDRFNHRRLSIFTFPGGRKFVRKFHMPAYGIGWPMCSDTNGDVFIPVNQGILEYAHGGTTPVATLSAKGVPDGCSSDPTTGNLAVTGLQNGSECAVAIYENAKGSPRFYDDPTLPGCTYPAYDGHGNLFLDGLADSGSVLTELPAGSSSFRPITLDGSIPNFWFVQWDGSDIAIEARPAENSPAVIFRVQVSGSTGTIVKTIHFGKWTNEEPYPWIRGDKIVDVAGNGSFGIWKYPDGGKILKAFSAPEGIWTFTVSVAPPGAHKRK
jgi:hypothetical protein